jgi:hypothetical protein
MTKIRDLRETVEKREEKNKNTKYSRQAFFD